VSSLTAAEAIPPGFPEIFEQSTLRNVNWAEPLSSLFIVKVASLGPTAVSAVVIPFVTASPTIFNLSVLDAAEISVTPSLIVNQASGDPAVLVTVIVPAISS